MVNGMVYFRDIHPILVGGLEHFFPYIGNNTPIWLIFFQRGLKPSTRISVLRGKMVIKPQISRASLFTMQTRYTPNCGDLIRRIAIDQCILGAYALFRDKPRWISMQATYFPTVGWEHIKEPHITHLFGLRHSMVSRTDPVMFVQQKRIGWVTNQKSPWWFYLTPIFESHWL